MPGSFCCIVGCSCASSRCRGVSFHLIPRKGLSPERDEWRNKLISAINRCDCSFNLQRAKICSRHFEKECFHMKYDYEGARKTLKIGSLPTRYMPEKSKETPKPSLRKPKPQNVYNSLKKHIKTHTGESIFKCDHCGEDFPCSERLIRHIDIHHGYACIKQTINRTQESGVKEEDGKLKDTTDKTLIENITNDETKNDKCNEIKIESKVKQEMDEVKDWTLKQSTENIAKNVTETDAEATHFYSQSFQNILTMSEIKTESVVKVEKDEIEDINQEQFIDNITNEVTEHSICNENKMNVEKERGEIENMTMKQSIDVTENDVKSNQIYSQSFLNTLIKLRNLAHEGLEPDENIFIEKNL